MQQLRSAAFTADGGMVASVPRGIQWYETMIGHLRVLAPFVDLAVRLFIASVFFKSGLTKIANWDSTLALFDNEYAVPLLPSDVAALLGTSVELVFPVLLAIGLGTRFSTLVLFIFNIVAVVSYAGLSAAGLKDHQTWGLLMLVTLVHGPGSFSADHWIRRRVFAR